MEENASSWSEALVVFPLENRPLFWTILWPYFIVITFAFSLTEPQKDLFYCHNENLVGLLKLKPMKMRACLCRTVGSNSYQSLTSHTAASSSSSELTI